MWINQFSTRGPRTLTHGHLVLTQIVKPGAIKSNLHTSRPSHQKHHFFPAKQRYATAAAPESAPIHPDRQVESGISKETTEYLNLHRLVEAYRNHGHYKANIDPLGSSINHPAVRNAPKLENFGFTASDLTREFRLDSSILPFFGGSQNQVLSLGEIVEACERTYCGTYSVEYSHVEDPVQRQWLQERLERPQPGSFSKEQRAEILKGLLYGAGFERLLASKFPTEKRYGLDGVESLVPGVAALIDRSAQAHGVNHVVVGSCHRGRLALAGTVYGKALEGIFAEFMGRPGWGILPGTAGDVKTHLGNEGVHITPDGRDVSISLIANPSHLESVDPVSQGSAHAAQRLAGEKGLDSVLCLALHGDAAFTGQGVVYETLGLSRLKEYDVGGTVRLLVNNQIGFTANPESSRSTTYCSDLAKFLGVPIFHVNSDKVEDVVFICQLAADWRATFKTDCVVDLVCYRRFGHNEMDQPRFTQPLLYEKISAHEHSQDIYTRELLSTGSLSMEDIDDIKQSVWNDLNERFELARTYEPPLLESPKAWRSLPTSKELAEKTFPDTTTATDADTMDAIAQKITTSPEGFILHNNVKRILNMRRTAALQGDIDWTAGEALALGSLALEGHHVRVLGEDAQRGTFSQRHAVFHDQKTGETWTPLANMTADQGDFLIENSPLSEYGAMGFEYGITVADPNSLVIWEAQFGDFANTAQVVIDNFISGAETKWGDRSGIVLSLPHGFDGQGAEHSSSRMERFLMLASEEGTQWPKNSARQHQDCNLQIVYPTTPANYFHVLRRQLHRQYRKPLIVLFSKSLLRSPLTRSKKSDFTGSSAFTPVIADPELGKFTDAPESVSRLILCTGQVYAALQKHRETENIRNVAITRIEELNPFPFAQLKENIDSYPNAETIVWAQEEHYNGGAWHHMRDRVATVLRGSEHHHERRLLYAGRRVSATTAVGSKKVHAEEEKALLEQAFSVSE